jgi:HAMP domain-containing protein
MDTLLVLLVGMIAGALLTAAYFGVCNLLKENAELRRELEAGKKRLPQNAENNLLNALAVILDIKMNLDADQLRLEQAMKILFAVREDPFGDADAPAGPRPKGMKV